MRRLPWVGVCLGALVWACEPWDQLEAEALLAGGVEDAGHLSGDAGAGDDAGSADAGAFDAGGQDAGPNQDAGAVDGGAVADAGVDGGAPDAGAAFDAGVFDAGTPDAGAVCSWTAPCGGGEVCEFALGHCRAAASCSATAPQPSTCGYGTHCDSGLCAVVPAATCGNLPSGAPVFDPATATGPVIYSVTPATANDTAFCGSGQYATSMVVSAYWSQAWPMPITSGGFFTYYAPDQSGFDATYNMRPGSGRTVNQTQADLKVTLCSVSSPDSHPVAFRFTGGNGFCSMSPTGTWVP